VHMPWINQVWIVGDVPDWINGSTRTIRLDPLPRKMPNQRQSLTAAVNHPDMADEILILNDDHYVMQPIPADDLPITHLDGTFDYSQRLHEQGFNRKNTWLHAVERTSAWVAERGYWPGCYETHTPLPYNRASLADLLARYPANQPLAYPELYPIAGSRTLGDRGENTKVITETEYDQRCQLPYLSSTDESWLNGRVGRLIRDRFPTPCRHEKG